MFFKKGQDFVIEHVSRHKCILSVIDLGKGDLGVSINEGLLVKAAHAFNGAHVVSVLRTEVARMVRFNLAQGLLFFPSLL